uniref:G-protein coupled receptors family 2 profile 2 domain-containing protein n=1 Tax=Branchiostoma floridae TaxID=7739 RepID=C3ZSB3_BRAFL|eukprot:XP_002588532.1 hypothetical protein BRAFLDRAFT_79488 [Branchiostoma floridae]
MAMYSISTFIELLAGTQTSTLCILDPSGCHHTVQRAGLRHRHVQTGQERTGAETVNKLSDSDHNRITRQIRRAFSIMALFGLTWVFGFFVINDARAVFAYLFCTFNTLQGLFIFVFHCVMREDIRKWWKKLSCSGQKEQGLDAVNGSASFSPAGRTSPSFELSTLPSGNHGLL